MNSLGLIPAAQQIKLTFFLYLLSDVNAQLSGIKAMTFKNWLENNKFNAPKKRESWLNPTKMIENCSLEVLINSQSNLKIAKMNIKNFVTSHNQILSCLTFYIHVSDKMSLVS
jgi:hypothetical protein